MRDSWLRDQLQQSLGEAYTIERELSGGGMSRVFVADEHALNRKVVVKVLPDDMAGTVSTQRFRREISLAARLHHPHIVPLLTAGETSGIPYYTMPFVEGETLRDRLERGPIAPTEAIRILREMASALEYAHERGVVHRDIKPDNVLLAGGVVAVTDFGVAKALSAARTGEARDEHETSTAALTSFGVALGTPAYMAPEQAAADPGVDHRADLYSLGCVAYEMLTGAPPFAGRTPQQTLAAHVTTEPPSIAAARPDLSPPLAELVMRSLAKQPGDRPQSAKEVVGALDAMVTTGGGLRVRASPTGRLRRAALVAVSGVAVVTVGVVLLRSRASFGAASADVPKSVGVLPFANLSDDKSNAYFSEGVTQEITTVLGKLPGLRVAAQDPTAAAPNAGGSARAIGRALGVETILMGSVQRAGDRVRIVARLVKVADGSQVWSDSYDRTMKDVFAVQDDIARAIVAGLRLTLAGGQSERLVQVATSDPEAHSLYLQGMYYWNRRTTASLEKSIELFKQAIARDSSYAAPWAGLALAYAVIVDYADLDMNAMADSALAAGRKALALDSTSADAYAAIGQADANRWQNGAGLEAFRHAVALDPGNARARHWYAELLAHVGQFDEAVRQVHKAQELEPLTLIINANVGRVELEARHYAAAEAALRHTIELDSAMQTAHALLTYVLVHEHKYDEAIAEQELSLRLTGGRPTTTLAALGYVYAVASRRAQAEAILRELRQRSAHEPISYGGLALLLSGLGRHAEAIAALDTAVTRYDALLSMRSQEEVFDPLRNDPSGAALFARAEGVR
ncbi:MAG TPA: protein kinase [Gemmatimonadaceae bacterium]|nr:protein kinase [Gemmatimonadaceae bacterium]